MIDSLLNNEGTWRLSVFIIIFLVMIIWETLIPRRQRNKSTNVRRVNNLGIMFIYTLVVRLVVPLLPVGAAFYAAENSLGLFNIVDLPLMVTAVLTLILFDIAIYFQHRISHSIPIFWRLHRMHHTDTEIDITTGIRFHPIEIVLSLFIKLAIVILLGAPAIAVLIFEVLLSSCALFNHSNVKLPNAVDKALRWIIVTPDMHRVHHSVHREETDSNFGFSVPWWDRIFGTYCAQPKDGHLSMQIGIETFRDNKDSRVDQLLIQPFK